MRKMLINCAVVGMTITSLLAPSTAAMAEPTKKDVLVSSRALNFINPKPSGTVTAAIVFDPADAASKADADALAGIIGSSLKAGKVTLSAKLVEVGNIGDIAGSAIAFIAEGTGAHHAAIAAAAANSGVLTASMDLDCVRSGNCALGVSTVPKVEIFVNKGAAGAVGVDFLPAFLMMVKEV